MKSLINEYIADSGEKIHRFRLMPSSAERHMHRTAFGAVQVSDAGMMIIQSSGRHGNLNSEFSL